MGIFISNDKIEELYLQTTAGFYLKECGKNAGIGSDQEGFYENQREEFVSGFRCAEKYLKPEK